MTINAQGFRYALEPLRARQAWRVDQALASLGRAAQRVTLANCALDEHRDRLEAQQQVRRLETVASLINPALHRAALGWLAWSLAGLEKAQLELDMLRVARDEARTVWQVQQSKLAVLDAHRTSELSLFQRSALSRAATQADSYWLARRSHQAAAESSFTAPSGLGVTI